MAVWPFSRMRVSWSSGQRITAAMAETLDSQQAQAANGNLFTDLAIAKNWYDAAVTIGTSNQAAVWNPSDRFWYIFGDNGGNAEGSRSYSLRSTTFTALTIPVGAGLSVKCAAASDSGIIIVGGNPGSASTLKIRESANGTTWNARSTVAGSTERVNSAVWHSGASLFIIGLNNSAATNIETSPDGQTWTQRTGLPNTDARGPMCSNGTIAVILAGPTGGAGTTVSTNKCLTTTDGVTYTERTLPTTQAWTCGVIWDERYERFLAFGESNWAYSSDGITWTDGGANPVSLSGNAYPGMGVCNIGRCFLIYGVSDQQAYAGVYDGVTMEQWLVIDTGDHAWAAASDGQFVILNGTTIYRTFAGGL